MTHNHKRRGTTTLFAALNTLDGSVIGQCLPRHRHQEFLKFLRRLNREFPKKLQLHLVVDNYQSHKDPNVDAWLEHRQRFHVHSTSTSSSWLDLVERRFAELTNKAIRCRVFHSVPDLIAAIDDYLANYNDDSTPFTWTASAHAILEKIILARAALPDHN